MSMDAAAYWVKHAGFFNDVAQGDFRASIDMRSISVVPHLYALGPVEGQIGEITVFDGRPDITTVEDGQAKVHTAWPKASFLVYASVGKWAQIPVPEDVKTIRQLESFVGRAAVARKLLPPFPFLIRGAP